MSVILIIGVFLYDRVCQPLLSGRLQLFIRHVFAVVVVIAACLVQHLLLLLLDLIVIQLVQLKCFSVLHPHVLACSQAVQVKDQMKHLLI